ncbi:MAG TPA: hypothetical protein VGJ45_18015, partial [Pseudonocardiaceae bacterium]
MRAADPPVLAELVLTGGQPGEPVDQVPEPDRTETRTETDQQGDGEQTEPAAPQPGERDAPSIRLSGHPAPSFH